MNIKLQLGNREFHLQGWTNKKYKHYVSGITNKCEDGRYVLFMDYDRVELNWVMEELLFLIEEYTLGDVHLFKTNKGIHAICTDKFSLRELVSILRDSSTDDAYTEIPLRTARKAWTLRLTEKNGVKPKYIETLTGYQYREQSKPHNEILRKIYSLEIPTTHEDNEQEFTTAHYYVE